MNSIFKIAIVAKINEIAADVDAKFQPREKNVINQIKEFRAITGFKLKDSKNIVESFHHLKKIESDYGDVFEHHNAIMGFERLVGDIVAYNFNQINVANDVKSYTPPYVEPVVPQLVLFHMNNKARYYRADSKKEAENFCVFIDQEDGYVDTIIPDVKIY